jgi:hypothetical protein
MRREILTYPLSKQDLREELRHFVAFFGGKGVATCRVLFGSAWGIHYYPGKEWSEEEVALTNLITKVEEVEASGIGKLGLDDLFLKVPGMEFLFCNDSDIHVFFTKHHPDIESFYQRWKTLGFKPAEWLKNERHGPGEKVRDA